jgi:hypothetical protein
MFFSAFHEKTWWWESTIAGRKIVIAMLGVFGATMESMQVHLTLMLVVLVLLITAQVRPFGGSEDTRALLQRLEMASLMAIFLTLWAASVFYIYPKCQDPLESEGTTLAWCDVLSVTVGFVDIVLVFVLIGCYVWLKARGGGEENQANDGEEVVVRRSRVLSAVGDNFRWLRSRMMSEESRQTRARKRTVDSSDPTNQTSPNPLEGLDAVVSIEMVSSPKTKRPPLPPTLVKKRKKKKSMRKSE